MIKLKVKNINKEFKELREKQKLQLTQQRDNTAKKLFQDLINVTPIDTGLAKASWSIKSKDKSIDITNSTDYIQYLNEGSSKQAPARFIETTALNYGKPLGNIVVIKPE